MSSETPDFSHLLMDNVKKKRKKSGEKGPQPESVFFKHCNSNTVPHSPTSYHDYEDERSVYRFFPPSTLDLSSPFSASLPRVLSLVHIVTYFRVQVRLEHTLSGSCHVVSETLDLRTHLVVGLRINHLRRTYKSFLELS